MKSVLLIFFVAGALFLSGCARSPSHWLIGLALKNLRPKQIKFLLPMSQSENRSEAFARFATGISYEINEQSDLALEEFYRAALADPSNEALALELVPAFFTEKGTGKSESNFYRKRRRNRRLLEMFFHGSPVPMSQLDKPIWQSMRANRL